MNLPKELTVVSPLSKILAAILFIALPFAGFFLGMRYQTMTDFDNKDKDSSMKACTEEAKICPDGSSVGRTGPNCEFATCPSADSETANWKTYRNPTYNYSLSYPSDWSLLGTPNVAFSSLDNQTTTGGTTIHGGKIVILVSNYKAFSVNLITDMSLAEFYKNVYSNKSQTDFVVIDRKDISISNILALRYVAEAPGTDDGTMTGAMVVYGNNVYQIEANYGRKDKLKTLEVFDQILSTFKFTDQAEVPCLADAKQCTDGSYVVRQPPTCEFAKCP